MDPSFTHPQWIVAGVLLIIGGFWLFRWGRRNDKRADMAAEAANAAINKLLKNPAPRAQVPAGGGAAARFRNSMAQFLGIVGALMIIAGIVAMIFGAFYTGS